MGREKSFAEFFAGIGLVHAGLGGWRCVYANDIEPKKRDMYEAHFGASSHYHVGDVWDTDAVLRRIGEPFLATASFPCVDLSLAGRGLGFGGERSSTYFGFLEVIRRMPQTPPLVMLENVTGFLTARGGADVDQALMSLAELGYRLDVIVLDARWFVPQSRPRAFVFGFHESLEAPALLDRGGMFDAWGEAVDAAPVLRPPVVRSVLDRVEAPLACVPTADPSARSVALVDVIDLDADQDWWDAKATARHYDMMEGPSRARVDDLIQRRATGVGTAFRRTRRGAMRCEVRFDMAGCLRTPKGGSAKQIVVAVVEGELRMRWMSAREYARLQGADDFVIEAPALQAMYGFGDAVCVPAIEWIDRHILTPLFESAVAPVEAGRG